MRATATRRLVQRLAQGPVRLRPMTSEDGAALEQVFAGMSPESRRNRYLDDPGELSEAVRAALLDIDGRRHLAVVAEVGRRGRKVAIGIGRCVIDGLGAAEIAYEVVDAWQGRGVGRRLVRWIVDTAHSAGIEHVHATLLRDNVASMGLLRRELPTVRVYRDGGLLHVTADLGAAGLETAEVLHDLGLLPQLRIA